MENNVYLYPYSAAKPIGGMKYLSGSPAIKRI